MPSLAIAGWVLLRLLRQLSTWLWIACAGLLWIAAEVLSPIGMTVASRGITPVFYEVAFLSIVAGCALALLPLSEAEWFLARLAAPARLRARMAGLLAGGGAGFAAALLLPALGSRMSLFELASFARDAAWTLLHASLLGLPLAGAPWSATTRALALPVLCWVLPATLPDSGLLGRSLHALLDASAHFGPRDPTAGGPSHARWIVLLALISAALLVEARSKGRTPSRPEPLEAR